MTKLPTEQPEMETDKLICTELIDMGLVVRINGEIKPNIPYFTPEQNETMRNILEPFAQELFNLALDRVELTRNITNEHTPERFQPYAEAMIVSPMYEEISDITRLLVEDNWLVPWTGMNPTNLIFTK